MKKTTRITAKYAIKKSLLRCLLFMNTCFSNFKKRALSTYCL